MAVATNQTNTSVDPFFNPKNSKSSTTTPIPSWPGQVSIDTLTQDSNTKLQASSKTPSQTLSIQTWNSSIQSGSAQSSWTPASVQPVATPQIVAKQGSRISFKTFAVGCGIFFWLFLLLVIVWLYIAISNPDSLANLGLDISTVKSVLLIFAVVFFGLLFFSWFAFGALNAYRLFTVKEGSKLRYIIGLIVWVLLVFGSIGLWFLSYNKINAISEDQIFNTNDLILPYVQLRKFEDGEPSLNYSRMYIDTPGMPPLVAPTYMDMQINRTIADSFGILNLQLTKIQLDCGNGQIISNDPTQINIQTLFFNWSCLYLKKGQYIVKILYTYFDPQQATEVTKVIDTAATIDIPTDFDFSVEWIPRKLNDNKNEIILWTAPTKLLVDAQKIFTDLNIPTIQVAWDLDGNGSIDKQNRVSYTYYFDQPKLYNSYFSLPYTLPNGQQIWYLTRFRVNAGDVPLCNLQTNRIWENQYELAVQVDDLWTDIAEYSIDIIDNQTDEIINTMKSDKFKFNYTFPNGKSYRVRGYFTTTESKRWSCEAPALLDIGFNSYSFINTISVIWPNDTSYRVLTTTWESRIEADSIILSDIPSTVKLTIDKLVPDIDSPQISLFENNILKNPTKTREYVLKIDSIEPKTIRLVAQDSKWKSAQKEYTIIIERKNLIGKLIASKTVWFDPLIVELDASITKLNDPTDEVVYFTREFGDGEVRKNTSVGKIAHTYKFDPVTENGEFQPKVTIKTRKWLTQTIVFSEKIIVKRQIKTFDILIPSHPAQVAKPGDLVELSIQADGKVTGVTRDFGNGKKLQGQGREFVETSMRYNDSGIYEIFATVEFADHPPVSQSVKLKVE